MKVFCITDQTSFPFGEATASRITMIGKALLKEGIEFILLSNYNNKNSLNKTSSGIHEGIHYYHLCGSVKVVKGKLNRIARYLKGLVVLFFYLFFKISSKDVIHLYSHGSLFNLYIIILAKIKRIKIVQEVNELTDLEERRFISKMMYKNIMFKFSDGVLAISKNIEERILKNKNTRTGIKIFRLPILTDITFFQPQNLSENEFYGLWMGMVDGYIKDILFIIESLGLAYKNGYSGYFYVVGRYNNISVEKIRSKCVDAGLPFERIVLLGYLTDEELLSKCINASFFVAPLWNDLKSENRFPTKIAYYLGCSKPVITCKIGEIEEYLEDKKSVLFYLQEDNNDLAQKILWVSENHSDAKIIGKNGYKIAAQYFNYENYSGGLKDFFANV